MKTNAPISVDIAAEGDVSATTGLWASGVARGLHAMHGGKTGPSPMLRFLPLEGRVQRRHDKQCL